MTTTTRQQHRHGGLLLILLVSLSYRLFFGVVTRSAFVPDEYFQAVEPAHQLVWGGTDIKTWEWSRPFEIRSYGPILPYAFLFSLSKYWNLPDSFNTMSPRVFQSLLASIGDICLFQIAHFCCQRAFTSRKVAHVCFAVHLFSWSCSYMFSRTLINGMEANFLLIAVCFLLKNNYIPYQKHCFTRNGFLFATLSHGAVIIGSALAYSRPTAVLFWIPSMLSFLFSLPTRLFISHFVFLNGKNILIAFSTWLLLFALDCYCYGHIVVTPWNFYNFNIVQNYSAHFGTHPFLWYFTHALPTLLGCYFPILCLGFAVEVPFQIRYLLRMTTFYVLLLSVVAKHKEIRFLLPILPFLHIVVGCILGSKLKRSPKRGPILFLALFSFVAHIGTAFFLSTFHQIGGEASFRGLATLVHQNHQFTPNFNVHLLASCHSFPGLSFLPHLPNTSITLYEPDCFPRLNMKNWSESAMFERNPSKFWEEKLQSQRWPDPHFVLTFDVYTTDLEKNLRWKGCIEVERFRHTYFRYDLDDPNIRYFVVLYRC